MNPPNHKSSVTTNQLNAAEYFTGNIQDGFIHSLLQLSQSFTRPPLLYDAFCHD